MNARPKKPTKTPNYPRLSTTLLMMSALTGCAGETMDAMDSDSAGGASVSVGGSNGSEPPYLGTSAGVMEPGFVNNSYGGASATATLPPLSVGGNSSIVPTTLHQGGMGQLAGGVAVPFAGGPNSDTAPQATAGAPPVSVSRPEIGEPGGVIAMPFGGTSGMGSASSQGGSTSISESSNAGGSTPLSSSSTVIGTGGAPEVISIPRLGGVAPISFEPADPETSDESS